MGDESSKTTGELSREITALSKLTLDELKERWRLIYQSAPPGRSSRKLLVSTIAYRMQERALGGLKPAVRALLERVSENSTESRVAFDRPATKASAGTVLIRDWRGHSHHHVTCSSMGFCTESKITDRFHKLHASSPAPDGRDRSFSAWSATARIERVESGESPIQRCAIYTRKSSEEGLEQDFNSLHAQREACEAFVESQAGEGWRLVKTAYDDGGLSGGTMERPALQRLLSDIDQGLIDIVAVYKIDRLTRSLTDFAKIVEIFDAHHVSFISTTQQFNTTSSMGRLTLNILLSFAQFEREVTGERIRDKVAASKKKGMWLGGYCSLGYDLRDHQLIINPQEAKLVRYLYKRYLELGSIRLLKQTLDRRGIVSKRRIAKNGRRSGGKPFSRGALYALLANPVYLGEIRHKELRHPGQHQAIVDRKTWEEVQQRLRDQTARVGTGKSTTAGNFLAGRLFDENDHPLRATRANGRHGGHYRYYVSRDLVSDGRSLVKAKGWRLAAKELEQSIIVSVRAILDDRAAIATAAQEAGAATEEISLVLKAAEARIGLLDSLSHAPLAVGELVKRVGLRKDGIELSMNLESLLPLDAAMRPSPWTRFTRFVPLQMKRRGVAMRLVIGGEVATPKTDWTLLKAVARGHQWFNELISGRASFARDIATREGVNERFVRRLIPLAFLSPTIVEAIAEGRQPISLTNEALSRGMDIPADWDKQFAALGFDQTIVT